MKNKLKDVYFKYKKHITSIAVMTLVTSATLVVVETTYSRNNNVTNAVAEGGITTVMSSADTKEVSTEGTASVNANSALVVNASSKDMVKVSELDVTPIEENLENSKKNVEVYEKAAKEEQEDESVITAYTNLGVANVDTYLNIREEADEGASIIGKLPVNAGCEVIKEENDWYYIQSGSVTGYVKAEYILTGDEANKVAKENLSMVAYVNADVLMVREEKSTDSKILSYVANGEEVEVAATADDWTQVNIDDITGYVKTEYVDIYKTLPKAVSVQELKAEEAEANGYSSTAAELVAYAEQFLGNPYVWGGTSLTNGTDCSGFTMSVYAHFGYSLSRTSAAQSNNGTRVSLDELQPGDLLFYNHGSSIGHVAIYIGNGQIIHASTEKTGIIISNAFYTTPACATRILN
ncbi:MAG: C40 family peptidase [Lachnospiraceae bacterium]|jgi:cell wall-associated NlpC family hydrolase|nr:C40 family peptidase [Lachnospiraceae bacterium]